jgi:hypothetical protein
MYVTAIDIYDKYRGSNNLTKKQQQTPVRWRKQGWTKCHSYNHSFVHVVTCLRTHLNSRCHDTPVKKCCYIGSRPLFWEDKKNVRMLWEHCLECFGLGAMKWPELEVMKLLLLISKCFRGMSRKALNTYEYLVWRGTIRLTTVGTEGVKL